MATFSDGAVAELQSSMVGNVSRSGEINYDEAVSIWNGAITRRPAIVASCANSDDVVAALAFAQREGLEVSIRGGGHNYAGYALCDDGLMIDLTPMNSVSVNVETRRAKCGGGTTWGAFDAATQSHGLAVTGGFISHTGVAGLTLGGGVGWLSRMVGLSSDNLVGAQVVTAEGRVVHASESENSELLWALRGGGGNFGVVTEFEFALYPVGPMVHLAMFLFSPEQGGELFRFARDFVKGLPDECGVFLAGLSAPPAPFVPEELHFTPVYALLLAGFGDADAHAELIAPIRKHLSPLVEMITPIPYANLQQMFDESAPWGLHSYEKALYLVDISDGAIETILEHQAKKMSPLSFTPIFVMGGTYRRFDSETTAFGGRRDVGYVFNISATTSAPEDYDAERAWVRAYWSALVEHAEGVGSYVNFMTEYEEDRVRSAYGSKYDRLEKVKGVFDPNNVFPLNANIPPKS